MIPQWKCSINILLHWNIQSALESSKKSIFSLYLLHYSLVPGLSWYFLCVIFLCGSSDFEFFKHWKKGWLGTASQLCAVAAGPRCCCWSHWEPLLPYCLPLVLWLGVKFWSQVLPWGEHDKLVGGLSTLPPKPSPVSSTWDPPSFKWRSCVIWTQYHHFMLLWF